MFLAHLGRINCTINASNQVSILHNHWICFKCVITFNRRDFNAMQRGVSSAPAGLLSQALEAQIVTFGSPSAVKAWVVLAGLQRAAEKVCGVLI